MSSPSYSSYDPRCPDYPPPRRATPQRPRQTKAKDPRLQDCSGSLTPPSATSPPHPNGQEESEVYNPEFPAFSPTSPPLYRPGLSPVYHPSTTPPYNPSSPVYHPSTTPPYNPSSPVYHPSTTPPYNPSSPVYEQAYRAPLPAVHYTDPPAYGTSSAYGSTLGYGGSTGAYGRTSFHETRPLSSEASLPPPAERHFPGFFPSSFAKTYARPRYDTIRRRHKRR